MFNRVHDFNEVLKYADDFGYVVWKSEKKLMMFVSAEGHEHVKAYILQKSKQ